MVIAAAGFHITRSTPFRPCGDSAADLPLLAAPAVAPGGTVPRRGRRTIHRARSPPHHSRRRRGRRSSRRARARTSSTTIPATTLVPQGPSPGFIAPPIARPAAPFPVVAAASRRTSRTRRGEASGEGCAAVRWGWATSASAIARLGSQGTGPDQERQLTPSVHSDTGRFLHPK
jgi:hypothetical protein